MITLSCSPPPAATSGPSPAAASPHQRLAAAVEAYRAASSMRVIGHWSKGSRTMSVDVLVRYPGRAKGSIVSEGSPYQLVVYGDRMFVHGVGAVTNVLGYRAGPITADRWVVSSSLDMSLVTDSIPLAESILPARFHPTKPVTAVQDRRPLEAFTDGLLSSNPRTP